MSLTDKEINDLYVRSVNGCLVSREALYNQYAAFLNSLCNRQSNKQFPVRELMSFANDTFMNIIQRNLFDPTKGVKFISYLGRSVSMELVRLKIRFKHSVTNKKRTQFGNEFISVQEIDSDVMDDDCNKVIPFELLHFDNIKDDDKNNLLKKLLNTLTNDEKMILFEHYKLVEPTKKSVSRQAIDQKRYKIERKLKLRLKELQNKGEL